MPGKLRQSIAKGRWAGSCIVNVTEEFIRKGLIIIGAKKPSA